MIIAFSRWFSNLKCRWSQEQCYKNMEYNNKAAMGCCYGLDDGENSFLYPCSDCPYFVKPNKFKIKILNVFDKNAFEVFKIQCSGEGTLITDPTFWPDEFIYITRLTLNEVSKIPLVFSVEQI